MYHIQEPRTTRCRALMISNHNLYRYMVKININYRHELFKILVIGKPTPLTPVSLDAYQRKTEVSRPE